MPEVVIVSAVRTPVGRVGGAMASIRPDDLAAMAIGEAVRRAEIDSGTVDEVMFGCANQSGEDGRNVARMALLLAGFPDTVPGITFNRLCASGLSAVNMAARTIACGDAEVVVAGGVESMSRAPWAMAKSARPYPTGNLTIYDTSLGWRFPNPALEARFPLESMGVTAENLVDRYEISRERQDAYALASHQKAIAAQEKGAFDAELLPVPIPRRKQPDLIVDRDEGPRPNASLEALARLRPVFREKGGSVTAGNSSSLNDGASSLVLMSRARAKRGGHTVLARFVASAAAGVDPQLMGIGPVPAIWRVLTKTGHTLDDIRLIELNEAFAAQSLAVLQALKLDDQSDRVNINGGAIALGHPLGCTGARILTTLIHALRARGGGLGLATLCVGVGQGVATLVEVASAG